MAAPTNVSVEATSITTTKLWWDYTGSNRIAVYRSTDGSSYAEVTVSATRVYPGTATYADSGLASATKYWYKLSDDAGVTFSSVVTVYTHTCLDDASAGFTLPRFNTPQEEADRLNDLAQRVEEILGHHVLAPGECTICPVDGALVVDCSDNCTNFLVIADQDINSISVNACDNTKLNLKFVVPPSTIRKICGWPAGFGFSGDECRKAPFVTGTSGGTFGIGTTGSGAIASPSGSSGKNTYNKGSGGGSGGGGVGGGCNCVPVGGALTIKCCSADCSMGCTSSTKSLQLKVCGGIGPFSWSKTGTKIGFKVTGGAGGTTTTAAGSSVTVVPTVSNTSVDTTSVAYRRQCIACNTAADCSGSTCLVGGVPTSAQYNCADTLLGCSTVAGCTCCGAASNSNRCCPGQVCSDCSATCPNFDAGSGYQCTDDVRSGAMIAGGCEPCGSNAAGTTVSVTDGNGVTTTVILRS